MRRFLNSSARFTACSRCPRSIQAAGCPRFFTSGRTREFIRPLTFLSQQSFGYLPTRETLAQQYARWRRQIPVRDGAPGDRAYVATGGPTYVRGNSAASSRVRTVTSRASRRGGSNTTSVMPRKLARHNRSSGAGAQSPKCQQRLLRPPAGAEGRSVSAGRFGYGPAVVVLIVAAVHALAHEFTPQPRPQAQPPPGPRIARRQSRWHDRGNAAGAWLHGRHTSRPNPRWARDRENRVHGRRWPMEVARVRITGRRPAVARRACQVVRAPMTN